MAPKISYVVCATHRSGSSLLCQSLWHTAHAGLPEEFFSPKHSVRKANDYGLTSPEQNFARYLRDVIDRRQTANGVFGAKLMWSQTPHLLESVGANNPPQLFDTLQSFLPGIRFIWNTRRDKLRQAISFLKAKQTSIFSSQQLHRGRTPRGAPQYDRQKIGQMLRRLEEEDRQWQRWFQGQGLKPLVVEYETFATDPETHTREILSYLEIELPVGFQSYPLTQTRMADEINEEWCARYQAESAAG